MHSLLCSTVLVALTVGSACNRSENAAPSLLPTTDAATSAGPLAPPAPALPALALRGQTPTIRTKMEDHFVAATVMQEALVRGDAKAFSAAAQLLAEQEFSPNLSETWRIPFDHMRTVARRAREAPPGGAQAGALAEVGQACADCHDHLGHPRFPKDMPPAEASGPKPHMKRHAWGAERLWLGLIGPDDGLWALGAEVLTDAPLKPDTLVGEKSVSANVQELADRVHALGTQARASKSSKEREALVASMYSSCFACHQALKVFPR